MIIMFTMFFSGGLIPFYLIVKEGRVIQFTVGDDYSLYGQYVQYDRHADRLSRRARQPGGIGQNRWSESLGHPVPDYYSAFLTGYSGYGHVLCE